MDLDFQCKILINARSAHAINIGAVHETSSYYGKHLCKLISKYFDEWRHKKDHVKL